MKKYHNLLFLFLLIFNIVKISAQNQSDSLYKDFASHVKKPYLSVGALLQIVGDYQKERIFSSNNGFNISNMRIALYGDFDKGIGYFIQTNFISSPAILDAKLYFRFRKYLQLDIGLFKVPFSKEFLTPASDIDFVNRAQIVDNFAPKRQIGMMINGRFLKNYIYYGIGIFNGNGFDGNVNDNNEFLYAGRIGFSSIFKPLNNDNNRFEIGINAASSNDKNINLGRGLLPHFEGNRELVGGDFRIIINGFLFSGDLIYANLNPIEGRIVKPSGFHLTIGYDLFSHSQVLIRLDSFKADNLQQDSNLFIVGYNIWPSRISEIQINYIIPQHHDSFRNHQILINTQIAF